MRTSLFVVLAAALVVQADSPKSELKKLEGDWQMASGEIQGKKVSEERAKATTLAIKGDKYTLKRGDNTLEGTLKLDPGQKPKAIDSIREGGETLIGIYELKADEFKVCLVGPGKDRPKDFSSGDIIHVWKRMKK